MPIYLELYIILVSLKGRLKHLRQTSFRHEAEAKVLAITKNMRYLFILDTFISS